MTQGHPSLKQPEEKFLLATLPRKFKRPLLITLTLHGLLYGGIWLAGLKSKERANLADNVTVLMIRTRNALNASLDDLFGSKRSAYKDGLRAKLNRGEREDPEEFYFKTEVAEKLADEPSADQAHARITAIMEELTNGTKDKTILEALNLLIDRKYQGAQNTSSAGHSTSVVRLVNDGEGNCEARAKLNDILVYRLFPVLQREMQFLKIDGQVHVRLIVVIEGQRYALDGTVFPLYASDVEGTVVTDSGVFQNAYVGRKSEALVQPRKDEKYPAPLAIQGGTDSIYDVGKVGIDTENVKSEKPGGQEGIGRQETVTRIIGSPNGDRLRQPGDLARLEKVSEKEARQLLGDPQALARRLKKMAFYQRSDFMRLLTAQVITDQIFLRNSLQLLYRDREVVDGLFGQGIRLNPMTVVMESLTPYSIATQAGLPPERSDEYYLGMIWFFEEDPGVVAYSLARLSPEASQDPKNALWKKLFELSRNDSKMAAYVIAVLSENKGLDEFTLKAIACSDGFSDSIRLDAARGIDDIEFLQKIILPTGQETMRIALDRDSGLFQGFGPELPSANINQWAANGTVNKMFSARVQLILNDKRTPKNNKKSLNPKDI